MHRLDQCHPRAYRRGDVGAHQSGSAGTDHHQVAVESSRSRPARVELSAPPRRHRAARYQGEHAEQHKGRQQAGRENAGETLQLSELGAGVHVDERAGEHPDLAHRVEAARGHGCQAEQQVDQEKRKNGYQSEREKIARTVARDPCVDGLQPVAEMRLHQIPREVARHQEGEQRADAGGKGHQQQAPAQSEQRAHHQRHHRGAGQGQGSDEDVHREECRRRRQRLGLFPGQQGAQQGANTVKA